MTIELAVCAAYRIRHSEFLGWDADDRDKAIWQYIRERQACRDCGTRPDEWDPKRGGDRNAYLAERELCRGCEVLQGAQASLAGDPGRIRGERMVLIRSKEVRESRGRS
ncbi:hypothetical protein ACFYY8_33560 [Streptosporangium sp. NPDC001559]|uniref:Uncharacterized protein n=1 Tax=Streptosporangium jomthongense TaxID=1193683 RepID=A0ABV8FHB4_9ACTN